MKLKNFIAAFISFCFLASVLVTTASAQPITEYAIEIAQIAEAAWLYIFQPAEGSPEVAAVGPFRAATGIDFGVVKVDRSGEIAWVRTYNGTGNGDDTPRSVTGDNAGNIIVTGDSRGATWDIVTIKYDSYGNKIWESIYDNGYSDYVVDIVADEDGRSYWTGYTWRANEAGEYSYDLVTQRIGVTLDERMWTEYYDSGGNPDVATCIDIDPSKNVYVSGISSITTNDIITIKYDTNGNRQWVYRKDLGGQEEVRAAAIDDDGVDLRVTGYTYIDGTWKGFVISIDTATGNERYARVYDSDAGYTYTNFEDVAYDGHITFVTGRTLRSGGNWDGITKKLDSNGAVVWNSTYDAGSNDYFWAIASKPLAIAAGATERSDTNYDGHIVAYDTNGNYEEARYDNGGNEDQFRILDIANGSAFCGGYTSGAGSSSGLLAKYRIEAAPVYTPVGTNVTVTPNPYVTCTYPEVTQAGYTSAIIITTPTDPPPGSTIIGTTFDLGISGVVFTPPITLTIKYDPNNIPVGVEEEDLFISRYDEESNYWIDLTSQASPDANTVTALTPHFSYFTIMAITDPSAAIGDLINVVQSKNLTWGIENSLDAKLQAALEALEEAKKNAFINAINKLQAFINEVEAQSGKAIPVEDADQLKNKAKAIIAAMQ